MTCNLPEGWELRVSHVTTKKRVSSSRLLEDARLNLPYHADIIAKKCCATCGDAIFLSHFKGYGDTMDSAVDAAVSNAKSHPELGALFS